MNQTKRVNKGRGGTGGGFNRDRTRRAFNVVNTYGQNDESKSHNGNEVYQNRILIHTITKLLGCRVTLETYNGVIYDGILKTMSPKGDLILEMAHMCAKRNEHQKIEDFIQVPSRNEVINTLVLGAKHVVYMSISNVDLEEVKKDNFTDQAISSRGLNGQLGNDRQLQKWEDPSVVPDESLTLDEQNVNGLDPNEMFLANEKFGVKSTFDEDMLSYTTPIEGSKELEYKAERLAREIEEENNYRDNSELDSGKTEEELFSAVVRNSPSIEHSQAGKGKHGSPARDDSKHDASVDSPKSVSPKPQRVQQREPAIPDVINKPITVTPVEQVKKDGTTASNQVTLSTTNKVQPHVVGGEKSGINIIGIKESSPSSTQNKPKSTPEDSSKVKDELKQFYENFKLAKDEVKEQEDQKKKVTPGQKDQNTANTEQEQKDTLKATEQKTTENTQKTEEKPKFKLNPDAKEFKPCLVTSTKTPPLQPSYIPYAPSPTQGIHRMQGFTTMMRPQMKPRSPFTQGQRYMRTDDSHSGSPISATAATGSPIIAQPGPIPQFIALPSHQQFPNMVHQMPPQGYNIQVHPGHQGGQQHYMPPQTVGMSTAQSVAQGYQENTMPLYVPSNIQMAPAPSYPGSPQASPTTSGQFQLQYIPQMIPQQQGNQPMPQAVIAHSAPPPQPVFVVPQQPNQQPVAMHGIPGPGSPLLNQFVPVTDYGIWIPTTYTIEAKDIDSPEDTSVNEDSVGSQEDSDHENT